MKKSDKTSDKRIEILVKAFMESEFESTCPKIKNLKDYSGAKRYFRYLSYSERLTKKIQSTKDAIFVLQGDAVNIEIKKGDKEQLQIIKVFIGDEDLEFNYVKINANV